MIPNKIYVYEVGGEEPMIWDRRPLNARYSNDLIGIYHNIPDELRDWLRAAYREGKYFEPLSDLLEIIDDA